MYRGYIAHRAPLGHIAHIGAHIDILLSILCVYQYSTYLLYIANLVCILGSIRPYLVAARKWYSEADAGPGAEAGAGFRGRCCD